MRQYIRWFEDQVNKIHYDMVGEPMPKRTRFSWAAWNKTHKITPQGEIEVCNSQLSKAKK